MKWDELGREDNLNLCDDIKLVMEEQEEWFKKVSGDCPANKFGRCYYTPMNLTSCDTAGAIQKVAPSHHECKKQNCAIFFWVNEVIPKNY